MTYVQQWNGQVRVMVFVKKLLHSPFKIPVSIPVPILVLTSPCRACLMKSSIFIFNVTLFFFQTTFHRQGITVVLIVCMSHVTEDLVCIVIVRSLSHQQKVIVLYETKQASLGDTAAVAFIQTSLFRHPKGWIGLSGSAGSLTGASPRAGQ